MLKNIISIQLPHGQNLISGTLTELYLGHLNRDPSIYIYQSYYFDLCPDHPTRSISNVAAGGGNCLCNSEELKWWTNELNIWFFKCEDRWWQERTYFWNHWCDKTATAGLVFHVLSQIIWASPQPMIEGHVPTFSALFSIRWVGPRPGYSQTSAWSVLILIQYIWAFIH